MGAKTVVLSAGAIASSLILQRSGMGGPAVGKGLGFNIAAPMHAEFDEKLDSYAGLQISHTLRPANEDDLILETWFNPVGAESLFMPGWFSDHYRNMRRYDHMACVGVVVGTKRNASVKPGLFGRGLNLDYVVDEDDLKLVVRGLKLAGRAFLEADALKVMTTTFKYMPCTTEAELDQIERLRARQHRHRAAELTPAGRQRDQPRRRPRASSTAASACTASSGCTCATPASSPPPSP